MRARDVEVTRSAVRACAFASATRTAVVGGRRARAHARSTRAASEMYVRKSWIS
jgi:hypothetical protein